MYHVNKPIIVSINKIVYITDVFFYSWLMFSRTVDEFLWIVNFQINKLTPAIQWTVVCWKFHIHHHIHIYDVMIIILVHAMNHYYLFFSWFSVSSAQSIRYYHLLLCFALLCFDLIWFVYYYFQKTNQFILYSICFTLYNILHPTITPSHYTYIFTYYTIRFNPITIHQEIPPCWHRFQIQHLNEQIHQLLGYRCRGY